MIPIYFPAPASYLTIRKLRKLFLNFLSNAVSSKQHLLAVDLLASVMRVISRSGTRIGHLVKEPQHRFLMELLRTQNACRNPLKVLLVECATTLCLEKELILQYSAVVPWSAEAFQGRKPKAGG